MSTRGGGRGAPPTRGHSRRKAMLDLNAPPTESTEWEETSNVVVPQEVQVREPVQAAPIDVEALDDDVVESSPMAFAQAKHNAQRVHRRPLVVDVDSGSDEAKTSWRTTRNPQNNQDKRRRVQSNQTTINCNLSIGLESNRSSMREESSRVASKSPKEPSFNCPICLGPFVEPTSTKCGHIFCNGCIKTAIAAQAKCPSCRKKVAVKQLFRVFLPATS